MNDWLLVCETEYSGNVVDILKVNGNITVEFILFA